MMKKNIARFITLYRNIKFLCGNDLKNMYRNLIETSIYYNSSTNIKLPNILTSEETLEILLSCDKSLIRFGDGELSIIEGEGIACQKYDINLSKRLREILKTKDKKFIIGINREFYYPNPYNPLLNNTELNFRLFNVPYFRSILNKYIDYETTYCNGTITSISQDMIIEGVYEKFRKIWNKKEILIVTNKNIINKISYNIFDNALHVKYVYVPSTNAWDVYSYIYKDVIKNNKETLIIAMAGPTAKILVYDLTLIGYRVLDLGHLMKAYDFYKKNISLTSNNIRKFFMPD